MLGVSPLNQQMYTKDHDSGDETHVASPEWGNVKYPTQVTMNSTQQIRNPTMKTSPKKGNSLINTQHNSTQRVMEGGQAAESDLMLINQDTEKRDIKLIMQPNF